MKPIAVLLLILMAAAAGADAKSRRRRASASQGSDAPPGKFDYYILSLSWAPDFCARPDARQNSRECGRGNQVGFMVHGLWPQNDDGTHPKQCASSRPLSSETVDRMLPLMMDAGLVQHEWRDHGTCSGLEPAAYFEAVRRAFQSVQIPAEYKNLGQQLRVSPVGLESKFADANPSFGRAAFRVACGNSELSEIRIGFSKELKPRSFPAAERDCEAGRLLMRPVR